MKAAIEKAFSALSSYGRGRRVEGSDGSSAYGQELHRVETQSGQDYSLTPEELHSEVAKNSLEGDDVLFSKNNVFLKQPLLNLDRNEAKGARPEDWHLAHVESKSLDNHMLIPGFLFVTTRGSNFGTTLILNWAPNSSMRVPGDDDSINQRSKHSTVSSSNLTVCDDSHCNSISIDLCSMEMIRIFYHMDEKGFIVSGELVVKSKAEEFKVNIMCLYVAVHNPYKFSIANY